MSVCPGPCCGGCSVQICVTGCGANIKGDTVEIKSGATVISSGVTGAGGCVALSIPSSGSYTVVVIDPSFGTITGTHTLTCGGTLVVPLGSSPSAGCCCFGCPLPQNGMMLVDAQGTWPVAWQGSCTWSVCYQLSGVTVMGINFVGGHCVCTGTTTGDLWIQYGVICNTGTGTITVNRAWPIAFISGSGVCPTPVYAAQDTSGDNNFSTCPGWTSSPCTSGDPGGATDESSLTRAPSSCSPFAWSGTLTGSTTTDPVGGSVALLY
jgi:hypothetical protein